MFYRTIYVSNASKPMLQPDIAKVLEVSRRNNAADGLSGLLVFYQDRFFQVLEGPRAKVIGCYQRILRDPRHRNIVKIEEGPVQARAFADWKMGFSHPDSLDTKLRNSVLSVYSLVPPNSEARGADPHVRDAVRDFLSGFKYVAKQPR